MTPQNKSTSTFFSYGWMLDNGLFLQHQGLAKLMWRPAACVQPPSFSNQIHLTRIISFVWAYKKKMAKEPKKMPKGPRIKELNTLSFVGSRVLIILHWRGICRNTMIVLFYFYCGPIHGFKESGDHKWKHVWFFLRFSSLPHHNLGGLLKNFDGF